MQVLGGLFQNPLLSTMQAEAQAKALFIGMLGLAKQTCKSCLQLQRQL